MLTHFSAAAAATCLAGALMVTAAFQRRMLDRRQTRICPSCGRHIARRVCEVCTAGPR